MSETSSHRSHVHWMINRSDLLWNHDSYKFWTSSRESTDGLRRLHLELNVHIDVDIFILTRHDIHSMCHSARDYVATTTTSSSTFTLTGPVPLGQVSFRKKLTCPMLWAIEIPVFVLLVI